MSIKSWLTAALLSGLMACNNDAMESVEKDFVSQVTIPIGGNTYLTSSKDGANVGKESIKEWTSEEAVLSMYFKMDQAQQALLQLDLGNRSGDSELKVTIDGKSKTVKVPSGAADTLSVGVFDLPTGYVQVDMQGISKEGAEYPSLKSLIVRTKDEVNLTYVKDNESNRFYWGRRGPSVHLTYEVPDGKDIKWFYSELTVPKGADPIGSYYMANGFGEGYFGIQTNSENERRVLFSVWSPFHTDNPDEIPEDQKIKLLKKGEHVNTGEFGNEGSGGQSFLRYQWITGNTYKFLNSVEPDGKGNTVYTAYFFAPEVGEWQLIASFLRPKTDTWYKRPHSFLENFSDRNGYLSRMAFYDNQWVMDTEGHWTEMTKAKFTGDDIAQRAYRLDFEGGVKENHFFMKNGGFFNAEVELNSHFERPEGGDQPMIDFSTLE